MAKRRRLLPANIPAKLKKLDQWACWKRETIGGRESKPPYNPRTDRYADCNDPSTWVSFKEALAGYQSGDYDGLSFFLSPEDGLVGLDFDDCRNLKNRRIHKQITGYLDSLDTYTEVSPSGRGIRAFLCGSLPPGHRNKSGGVEIYTVAKALTVTGRKLKAYPSTVNARQDRLDILYRSLFGSQEAEKATRKEAPLGFSLRDPEIHPARINRLCNRFRNIDIRSLVDGNYSGYASPSDAEQALANYAAGADWTPQEIADLLILARRNTGEEPKHLGYYQATIAKALDSDLAANAATNRRGSSSCGSPRPKPDLKPPAPKKATSHKRTTLSEVKTLFHRHYHLEDDSVLDLILGIAAGNHLPGDPIWLYLIGPPSSGKTEFLNPLLDREDTHFISDLTPAGLISGYVDPETGEDKSLLPKLNGKLVVFKDFTVVLSKPRETRNQLYSILRDAYDGYSSRAMGTDFKGFHARFNLLAGVTPHVESSWTTNSPLGERFLSYRLRIEDRSAHTRKGLSHNGQDFRQRIREAVWELLDSTPSSVPDFPSSLAEPTEALSELLSHLRTAIAREGKEALHDPTPELPTRIVKQLRRIGQSIALIRGKDAVSVAEFEVMRKVAFDSIPSRRFRLLQCLEKHSRHLSVKEASELLSLSETTTRRLIDDFTDLGLLDSSTRSGSRRPTKCYRLKKTTLSRLSLVASTISANKPQNSNKG